MCLPALPMIMIAASVASTAVSVVTQAQSAAAQTKALQTQQATQEQQIRTAETAQINDQARAARSQQARIKTAAGAAGLSLGSGSIEDLLLNSVQQQGLADSRIQLNAGEQVSESRAEGAAAASRIQSPTLLGAGLQLGLSGLNGYFQGSSLQIQRDNPAKAAANQTAEGS